MATLAELETKVEECLREFYRRRLAMLGKLKLREILSRKNPYLFKALGIEIAAEIVQQILLAFVSSSDETIFGDCFFEPIALLASGGKVSDGAGVDFVIETRQRYTAVALKSGPNIFNASQRKRQNQEFNELRSRLYKIHKMYDPLLAYAYGRRRSEPSGQTIYRERSGQEFWSEITGDSDFHLTLIRLMKDIPSRHKKEHLEEWAAAVNRFTVEFSKDFCFAGGKINWDRLVEFVSKPRERRRTPKLPRKKPADRVL
jgi:hypothetical protein